MKRFIIIVLDGFGIGAMDDVAEVRPQDIGSNTAKHLLEHGKNINFSTILKLGLINAMGEVVGDFSFQEHTTVGRSLLAHYGADTFFGHQEIMGTAPKLPKKQRLAEKIEPLIMDLKQQGYQVEIHEQDQLQLLCVNQGIFIGDNLETDLGQAINVTGSLELHSFAEIKAVGELVRRHFEVPRIIAFGGEGVTLDNLKNAIRIRDGHIGVDAPKSGVYNQGYQVVHLGYGVDPTEQVPYVINQQQIPTHLYGKVADIVSNPFGKVFPGVDTKMVMDELISDLKTPQSGFYCLNVQETDLAGHALDSDRYIDRLNIADQGIAQVMELMQKEDVLVVMADHGNDPTATSSQHSREKVPLLIHKNGLSSTNLGTRKTMADVGATVADYFGTKISFGTSFLDNLNA